MKARRGYECTLQVCARTILLAVYETRPRSTDYHALGEAYLDQLDDKRVAHDLERQLEGSAMRPGSVGIADGKREARSRPSANVAG